MSERFTRNADKMRASRPINPYSICFRSRLCCYSNEQHDKRKKYMKCYYTLLDVCSRDATQKTHPIRHWLKSNSKNLKDVCLFSTLRHILSLPRLKSNEFILFDPNNKIKCLNLWIRQSVEMSLTHRCYAVLNGDYLVMTERAVSRNVRHADILIQNITPYYSQPHTVKLAIYLTALIKCKHSSQSRDTLSRKRAEHVKTYNFNWSSFNDD